MNLLSLLIAYPFAVLARGYTVTVLWGWFAVPAFGLPPLRLVDAVGLSILIWMFTLHVPRRDAPDPDAGWSLNYTMTSCGLALLFGWVWHTVL